MELEHIHALVNTEKLVNVFGGRADGASKEADESGNPNRDETGGRGNADETGDGTRACTNEREVTLAADVVDSDPTKDSEACCGVGVEGCHHGADGGVESRSAVEAEPTKPNEYCADEDQGGVVGLAVELLALVNALSEDEGIGKSGPS